MKVKLQDIADAIELYRKEISTYLNLKTVQVHTFSDEELEAAKK